MNRKERREQRNKISKSILVERLELIQFRLGDEDLHDPDNIRAEFKNWLETPIGVLRQTKRTTLESMYSKLVRVLYWLQEGQFLENNKERTFHDNEDKTK